MVPLLAFGAMVGTMAYAAHTSPAETIKQNTHDGGYYVEERPQDTHHMNLCQDVVSGEVTDTDIQRVLRGDRDRVANKEHPGLHHARSIIAV